MAAASVPNVPSQARPWSNEFKHTDRERWICIYPAYLNRRKTLKEGRRVPKAKGVDNPVCQEIRDICAAAGFTLGVENKVYSREQEAKDIRYRGRVRVQLRNEDGSPCIPQFKDRMSVFMHLVDMIPKLKSRQGQTQSSQSQPAASSQSKAGQKKKGGRK